MANDEEEEEAPSTRTIQEEATRRNKIRTPTLSRIGIVVVVSCVAIASGRVLDGTEERDLPISAGLIGRLSDSGLHDKRVLLGVATASPVSTRDYVDMIGVCEGEWSGLLEFRRNFFDLFLFFHDRSTIQREVETEEESIRRGRWLGSFMELKGRKSPGRG